MNSCGQCGAQNAADARFCNQCGHALAPAMLARDAASYTPQHLVDRVLRHRSAMEGERKQVTVLFADMAGSTRIAESLDPEDWHRVLDQFFSILSEEIHGCEGTVNQFTGDGVMALFGAPLALEDHAQRAARAALALRDRLRSFADGLRLELGINLAVRMGLNSGEVVVGRIGDDLRMDYTAKGMTVNLAARMEQIAQPGCVYLTSDTANLIADYFSLRPLGPMRVKGRDEALEVFELMEPNAVSLRLEASRARGLTGFAGRQAELALLRQAFDAAADSRQLRVVVGDGGLGKSRLCFEAIEHWRESGVPVLSCSGLPHGQSVPLQPVRDLIRQRFGVLPGDAPALARQKIAGALVMLDDSLRPQLPLLFEFLNIADAASAGSGLPPEIRDERVRALFRDICLLESSERRVILVEDLHWLDEGSQDFFRILTDCTGCTRTLIIFNTRPGTLPQWLSQLGPEIITLRPLTKIDMFAMTSSLLGHDDQLEPLAERIADQAAGNPFFIEETVRSLAASGQLQGVAGNYHLSASIDAVEIPATVQALIAGRVDRLSGPDKTLLQSAAILGQRFERLLLQHLVADEGLDLAEGLETLRQGNYLAPETEAGDGLWAFSHPLVQEVVYSSQLRDRRVALHRKVAHLLEQHFQQTGCERAANALMRHWDAAGEAVRSAYWCNHVARLLAQQDAQEQIRVLKRALSLLEPVPDSQDAVDIAIQTRAALMRVATFHTLDGIDLDAIFQTGRELAERSGNKEALAELLISSGTRMLNFHHADLAVTQTGEAIRLVQDAEDTSLESRFRLTILLSYFAAGRLREGLAVLDRRDGGAWHRRPVDEENMLSRGFRSLVLASMGELEQAEVDGRAALERTRKSGLRVSWLLSNLVDIQLLRGTLGDSEALAAEAMGYAEEFGSPLLLEVAVRAQAQVLLAQNKITEALELLEQASGLIEPGSLAGQFAAAHLATLAQAYQDSGDLPRAFAVAEEAINRGRSSGQRIWLLRSVLRKARIRLQMGEDPTTDVLEARCLIEETGAQLYLGDVLEIEAAWEARQGQSNAEKWAAAARHWQQCGAPGRAQQAAGVC